MAISDVVQPIVYVIDESVPAKWLPYVIQGVKAWLPAFDTIGFRNAMAVRVVSSKDSAIVAKNIVHIRMSSLSGKWVAGATHCDGNAATGEISGCDVDIGLRLVQEWGRVTCMVYEGNDPAVPLSCPDSTIGLWLQNAVTHEVGHTLGLAHNYYAGRAYPTDSLRSATFVHKWGFAPSILVHISYNEVAQPGDHIPQRDRLPQIGPYDIWALAWAYRSIPGAPTPEAELPTLERWRTAQDTAAYLRIQISDVNGVDGDRAWGGDDIILATELKLRNGARFWQRLMEPLNKTQMEAVMKFFGAKDSRDMDSLSVASWQSRIFGVANLLGGRLGQPPYPRDPSAISTMPIDIARQLQAIQFLLVHALYGHDPVLQIQKRSVKYSTPQEYRFPADSVPILFDTSAAAHSPAAIFWQRAQREILSGMTSRIAKMPPAAWPEACHYLSDAVHALTNVELRVKPSLKDEAETLRIALTPPSVCTNP